MNQISLVTINYLNSHTKKKKKRKKEKQQLSQCPQEVQHELKDNKQPNVLLKACLGAKRPTASSHQIRQRFDEGTTKNPSPYIERHILHIFFYILIYCILIITVILLFPRTNSSLDSSYLW